MSREVYLLGDQTCLSMPRIAVVGTRAVSPYGVRVTEQFVAALVSAGYVIVSGLALGVDAIAHRTAIKMGGKTIAVLAHGLDYCYPLVHKGLRKKILDTSGLLASAYPEGNRPTREQFFVRNELLVKLSDAVLATCSPHKSGVKNTVKHAAELGRDVYVIPGPVDDPSYAGTIEIIENGGVPVGSPEDLIKKMQGN